jgi:hypothetical protein
MIMIIVSFTQWYFLLFVFRSKDNYLSVAYLVKRLYTHILLPFYTSKCFTKLEILHYDHFNHINW